MVKLSALTFAIPNKKGTFPRGKSKKKGQEMQINFGDKIKTLTFALPIKKGVFFKGKKAKKSRKSK